MIKLKIFAETMSQIIDDCDKSAGKGMHIFVNDWCLSTQAGYGCYCSSDPTRNHYKNMPEPIKKLTGDTIRKDCEIAIWNIKDGVSGMIELDGDSVMGYVSWDMVFDIIEWLRKNKDIKVKNKVLKLKQKYDKV